MNTEGFTVQGRMLARLLSTHTLSTRDAGRPDPATGLLRDLKALGDEIAKFGTKLEALDKRRRRKTAMHATRDRFAAVMDPVERLRGETRRNMDPSQFRSVAWWNRLYRGLRGQ